MIENNKIEIATKDNVLFDEQVNLVTICIITRTTSFEDYSSCSCNQTTSSQETIITLLFLTSTSQHQSMATKKSKRALQKLLCRIRKAKRRRNFHSLIARTDHIRAHQTEHVLCKYCQPNLLHPQNHNLDAGKTQSVVRKNIFISLLCLNFHKTKGNRHYLTG